MQQIFAIAFILVFPFFMLGQNSIHLIIENESGQPLSDVVVMANELNCFGTSNSEGLVELSIPFDRTDIVFTFSHLGYLTVQYSLGEISQNNFKVILEGTSLQLDEVEVIGRRDERKRDLSSQVISLDVRQPNFVASQTTADILEQSGEVFVQKSQMGGGSPVVRGFEANRVLLVVDGVRMNNAIYRAGHLQNSISVDKASLSGMEVIFGPGALTYGSDALGGVVHFRTENPLLKVGDSSALVKTFFNTRLSTANDGKLVHAHINYGQKHWAVLSSFSYNDYGDLMSGKKRIKGYDPILRKQFVRTISGKDSVFTNESPYLQIASGFSQYNITQKWKFRWSDRWDLLANIQYSSTSDVPRYDQLTVVSDNQLKFSEWYYGPQNRLLTALQFRWHHPNKWFDKALVLGARQFIEEDRYSRKLYSRQREVSLVDVEVWSMTFDFEKTLAPSHSILYGMDWADNLVTSSAYSEDIESLEQVVDIPSRYPDGSSGLNTWGVYLNYRLHNKAKNGTLNAGVRYAYSKLDARFSGKGPIEWPAHYQEGILSNNSAVIGSVGWRHWMKSGFEYRIVGATSFRTPNIDDFTKIRKKNGFVTVPNPDLIPEKSMNGEFGVTWKGKAIEVGSTIFYTYLRDGITRQNFKLPNGDDYFVSHGDTLRVQANVNANKANIHGISVYLNWQRGRFRIQSNLSYTKGSRDYVQTSTTGEEVFVTPTPQDHIPPLYGRSNIQYNLGQLDFMFSLRYNGRKSVSDYAVLSYTQENDEWIADRSGTSDNIEDGWIDEDGNYLGTPAWITTNFYITWAVLEKWKLHLACENIGDIHYRNFSSGISAPGRNFSLSIRGDF